MLNLVQEFTYTKGIRIRDLAVHINWNFLEFAGIIHFQVQLWVEGKVYTADATVTRVLTSDTLDRLLNWHQFVAKWNLVSKTYFVTLKLVLLWPQAQT